MHFSKFEQRSDLGGWVLAIRGRSNWTIKKNVHTLIINILILNYSKTLLKIKKDFHMHFMGDIKLSMSFLRGRSLIITRGGY